MSNFTFISTADLICELHHRSLTDVPSIEPRIAAFPTRAILTELLVRHNKQQHAMQCMSESYSRLKTENLELAHEVNNLSECLIDFEAEASAEDLEP